MRNTLLIIILSLGYSWAANAQTEYTLQELKERRTLCQKRVAEANTKPHGISLRTVNEDIVAHISTKGYTTSTSTTATSSQLAVRDPRNTSKVVAQLQAGAQVVVYERIGKNSFLIRTDNDNIGLVHINAFGNALQNYPLDVLIQSQSPEEQDADDRNGVIEQRAVKTKVKFN